MKETKQGTMALVQVHVDLFKTTQRPNESVEAYYKIFCARRDTVNAHGGEAGYHRRLYEKACNKILAERGRDEAWITSTAGDATAAAKRKAIMKQAKKVCCEQFLAALFIKMADDERYLVPKAKLNNDFLFGDDKAPMTIVDAKRVLSDFSVPTASKTHSVKAEETEGTGLTFAEMSAERKRTIQCFGCGVKGHFLNNCTKTSTKKKAEILAMVKKGDFKTTKGVVQLSAGKGGDKAVEPPEDNDVERFQDFVGEQHMNVGGFELVDEPDYDTNPFGFFGINFGEYDKE